VNISESEQAVADLTAAGLRFTEWLFPAADHLTLATNDEYGPGADWLGEHKVDRNPPHVTYVVDPTEDNQQATAVGDHAFWTSGLTVREPKASPTGTFDARSEGFGVGDSTPSGQKQGGGVLAGGNHQASPYVERSQDWGPAPATPIADRLDVVATNVATATVDAARARLSCAPELNVKSDGPLDLRIDCTKAARAASCTGSVSFALPRMKGARVTRVVVKRGRVVLASMQGRNLRRVTVRRMSRQGFAVRISMTTSAKGKRVSVVRRISAC
jgi:hypothetical protein